MPRLTRLACLLLGMCIIVTSELLALDGALLEFAMKYEAEGVCERDGGLVVFVASDAAKRRIDAAAESFRKQGSRFVIEETVRSGVFSFLAGPGETESDSVCTVKRGRPAQLGASVGPPNREGSFAGRMVDGDGNVYLLGNSHVLHPYSTSKGDGSPIWQPTCQGLGCDTSTARCFKKTVSNGDVIGELTAVDKGKLYAETSKRVNTIDAVLARTTSECVVNTTWDGKGIPTSVIPLAEVEASRAQMVKQGGVLRATKCGQGTGRQSGDVACTRSIIRVRDAKEDYYWFANQIVLKGPFLAGNGDSGAMVVGLTKSMDVNVKDKALGLIFAGTAEGDLRYVLANPLDEVQCCLGAWFDLEGNKLPKVCTCNHGKIPK